MNDRKNYGQRGDRRRSRQDDLEQMERGLQRELQREMEEENLRTGGRIYGERKPAPKKPGKEEKRKKQQEEKRRMRKKRAVNRQYVWITYFFVLLFLVMIGHFAYDNVVQGKDIINDARNPRMNLYADQIKRGEIRDKDGNILAQTKENEDGTPTREYP